MEVLIIKSDDVIFLQQCSEFDYSNNCLKFFFNYSILEFHDSVLELNDFFARKPARYNTNIEHLFFSNVYKLILFMVLSMQIRVD